VVHNSLQSCSCHLQALELLLKAPNSCSEFTLAFASPLKVGILVI
jgi:hypothetical protein